MEKKSKRGTVRAVFTRTWNKINSEVNKPDATLDQTFRK